MLIKYAFLVRNGMVKMYNYFVIIDELDDSSTNDTMANSMSRALLHNDVLFVMN